jgi:endonuclease YncB( thermonuclease family)
MKKILLLIVAFLAPTLFAPALAADQVGGFSAVPPDDRGGDIRPGRTRPNQGPRHSPNRPSNQPQRKPRNPTVIIQVPPQVQIQTQTRTQITGPITVTREFPAVVLKVLDGDSLIVRAGNYQDIEVRLYGIDCPEGNQPGGVEATAFLRSFQGRQVTIREMDTDSYGRMVALVGFGGRSVNLDLATLGHAWYYAHYCRSQPVCDQIKAAEAEARAAGRGLWAGRSPVAPWEWRRGK